MHFERAAGIDHLVTFYSIWACAAPPPRVLGGLFEQFVGLEFIRMGRRTGLGVPMHADPVKGLEYAAKSVAFAPRDAFAHGSLGMWVGGPGSASLFAAANLRAYDLDPLIMNFAGNGAAGLCLLGRPQEALTIMDRVLRAQPDIPWGLTVRGYALLKLSRLAEAEDALRSSEPNATASHTYGALWQQIRFALAVA
jgi:hypothetical protein